MPQYVEDGPSDADLVFELCLIQDISVSGLEQKLTFGKGTLQDIIAGRSHASRATRARLEGALEQRKRMEGVKPL